MKRAFFPITIPLFSVLLLVGCSSFYPDSPTTTPTQTATATRVLTATPTPTRSPIPSATRGVLDTGWQLLQPGMEARTFHLYNDKNRRIESLQVIRVNQSQFRIDVAYDEVPKSLESWQAETKASIVINGGYFRVEDEVYIPNGLTILKGKPLGESYGSFAGMLAIREEHAALRWLATMPYDPAENLQAAIQSFPLLVKPGGKLGFPKEYEDDKRARRTVIGQDRDGNILFLVAPMGYFTLHQLSTYLTKSDLNVLVM